MDANGGTHDIRVMVNVLEFRPRVSLVVLNVGLRLRCLQWSVSTKVRSLIPVYLFVVLFDPVFLLPISESV